jgi:predicted Zn-dependent protease
MPDIQPGQRPALSSDEGGLWLMMDKAETSLKTSGRLVEDEALARYVNDIVCRLSMEHCRDIRVYIVRTPNFNATMAPNGSMNVWTGLLLRTQNEAQLAFVLGHEIAHYLRRHSLQRWQTIRDTADFLVFFKIAAAFAGVGIAGDVAHLIAAGSLAGYDPREAARIWTALQAEKDAEGQDSASVFFASHPSSNERAETIRKLAQTLESEIKGNGRQQAELQKHIEGHRSLWLRDELRRKRYESFRVLLDQQMVEPVSSALIDFYRGELFRLRAEDGDAERAIAAFEKAKAQPSVPATVYRSLGLVQWNRNELLAARNAFEQYLEADPNATDRAMIANYVFKLTEKIK